MDKSKAGESGGAWTEETHLKLHPTLFSIGLVKYIQQNIKPKSVLEFGSGLGLHAKYINDKCNTKKVHCIEPNEMTGAYNNVNGPILFALNIFEDKIPTELNKQYDLVMSTEVAEHIERKYHDQLFDFLVDKAENWIVFSGAHVGQGGHGHIACRPEEEWKKELTKRGMIFITDMTKEIRGKADFSWFKQNLMIFKK